MAEYERQQEALGEGRGKQVMAHAHSNCIAPPEQ
jgi:hypothetical protein